MIYILSIVMELSSGRATGIAIILIYIWFLLSYFPCPFQPFFLQLGNGQYFPQKNTSNSRLLGKVISFLPFVRKSKF